MKKKSVILVVIIICLALAGSVIGYGYFRKPKSSKELALKSIIAMKDTKTVEYDGEIDASASAFDSMTLPIHVIFDGNYSIVDQAGGVDFTSQITLFGQDLDYSDHIDFPEENVDDGKEQEDKKQDSLSEEEKDELLALLDKSEFHYDKENKIFTISIATKDLLSLSSVREKLFGKDSLFESLGLSEEDVINSMNDDSRVIAEFNKDYYLTKMTLESMEIKKEFDLSSIQSIIDLGKVPAMVSFDTVIHFNHYSK